MCGRDDALLQDTILVYVKSTKTGKDEPWIPFDSKVICFFWLMHQAHSAGRNRLKAVKLEGTKDGIQLWWSSFPWAWWWFHESKKLNNDFIRLQWVENVCLDVHVVQVIVDIHDFRRVTHMIHDIWESCRIHSSIGRTSHSGCSG